MNSFILIITGIIGAILTYFVSEKLKQGAVRASALLSIPVGLFFYFFPQLLDSYLTKNIPLVFIGATFIGMVSSEVKVSYIKLGLAGVLFSIIYIYNTNFFEGYGGSLGALALISLLASMGISVLFSKNEKLSQFISKIKASFFNQKK